MKVIIPFDDYNETIHTGLNFVGTVLPTWGHSALKNGWKLIEIMTPTEERGCWYKGRLVEPYSGCYVNTSVEFFRGGLRDLSRTLKADSEAHAAGVCVEHFSTKDMAKHYRIRKLTPKECMRLMKVSDEDFEKMKAAGISDSQMYKLAGNSIVVCVLEAIFTQMFRKDDGCLF